MRSSPVRTILLASLGVWALLLSACVTTWDYPNGPVNSPSKLYTVQLPAKWAWLPTTEPPGFVATFDGPSLQAIQVVEYDLKKDLPHAKERINASMPIERQADLYYKEVFNDPAHQAVTMEQIGPSELGGQAGFELTYTYTSAANVKYRAQVRGAIVQNKLVTLEFRAPVRHYYDRYDDDLAKVVSSFKLKT